MKKYDVIVVGGGHAGCEAAHASALKNKKTLLITINTKNIADMPCNPSIGGTAKGIVVREIDALGGIMGVVADKSHFQIKMLNNKKGPAVKSLRAQADKVIYPQVMLTILNDNSNLEIEEGTVSNLLVEKNKIKGVILESGEVIYSKMVILTTGTYLKSKILQGGSFKYEGPHGEKRAKDLSENLKKLGFTIQRLKTGTPPRIKKSSIDFTKMEIEDGDQEYYTFSHDLEPSYDLNHQEKCYLLYTNENTHQIIKENLDKSSMYGGFVEGVGPRYCPSIEDKIVRFSDKMRHQLFLEPESKFYDEWYLQGFSTSMPVEIQEKMVHSLKGLEKAEITKYAYAIEYDAIDPLQLTPSLETKIIENLFTAGQINGTSGYEEAAGQGLLAGINAALKLEKKDPLILKRNEAYLGVLIDDLVTKGTKEPYRLLTSRAEFRLILRHDNALFRLRKYGFLAGLIDEEKYKKCLDKMTKIEEIKKEYKERKLTNDEKTLLENVGYPKNKSTYENLIKMPSTSIRVMKDILKVSYPDDIMEQVLLYFKYEGYIKKEYAEVEKMLKLEEKQIPIDIDYSKIKNLASEARQKLEKIRPISIGQATRISGVNPTDISLLAIYLKKEFAKNERN